MKFVPVTRSFFLWQEISSNVKKFLLVTGHFCLLQEFTSYDKKFLPETRNHFLWQEISALDKIPLGLTRNFKSPCLLHRHGKMSTKSRISLANKSTQNYIFLNFWIFFRFILECHEAGLSNMGGKGTKCIKYVAVSLNFLFLPNLSYYHCYQGIEAFI